MPGTSKYDPDKGKVLRLEKQISAKWEGYLEEQRNSPGRSRNEQLKVSRTTRNTRLPSLETSFSQVSKKIAETDEVQEMASKFLLPSYGSRAPRP